MNTSADQDKHNKASGVPNEAGGTRSITMADNRVDSREFFAGTREITIVHGGETYRLRLTAQNKLILTK